MGHGRLWAALLGVGLVARRPGCPPRRSRRRATRSPGPVAPCRGSRRWRWSGSPTASTTRSASPSAGDGTGRIFVVERVGRIKVVAKDGRVLSEPFLDLTKTNPLGSEVQTGFVEQGLWSVAFHPKFKENGHIFVHYSSLPFNGASIVARYTVDRASPDRITTEQANKTVKVIMNIPQPYYNHYGGHDRVRPRRLPLRRQGRRGLGGRPPRRRPAPRPAAGQDAADRRRRARPRPVPCPPTNPMANAMRGPDDVAVRRHRGGIREDPAGPPGDLGVRAAQPLHVPLRPAEWRPLHCRRRPEPLGGDQLPAEGQQGGRELRLASQSGVPLPSADRAHENCPVVGVLPVGGVPAPGALSRRAQAHAGLRLLGARARRRELRGHEQGLPGGRLVLGPPLGGRLGRLALAARRRRSRPTSSSRLGTSTRTASSSPSTATASTWTTRARWRTRRARCGGCCRRARCRPAR